ncbi:MAG: M20/M25/M40 family metallo-hydrolase, partial [Bdellovibrionales bacterium]
PESGENAIMKMMAYLAQLPEGIVIMDLNGGINYNSVPAHAILEIDTVAGFRDPIRPKISRIYSSLLALEAKMREFREEGFRPPYPTMNLGMVRTSEAEVRFTGSCRFPPTVTDAIYDEWMHQLEKAVQDVGSTFRVREYRKGFTTPAESEFLRGAQQILTDMGLDPNLDKVTLASAANVFSRLGIECVVWGPGQSVGNSHAPNECVKLSDLKTATEFYKRLLERFCL